MKNAYPLTAVSTIKEALSYKQTTTTEDVCLCKLTKTVTFAHFLKNRFYGRSKYKYIFYKRETTF
jgi:hypothetical protein